jgi:hypothetical protein
MLETVLFVAVIIVFGALVYHVIATAGRTGKL